jgi:putative nucleotidyltransferase with HDIG domain
MPEGYIALSGIGPKTEGLKWESERLLRIGRQASLEVVLRDTSVERLHAEIKFQGQRWMLKDLADSSFYPTILNGKSVSGKSEQLKLNDLIQVGKLKMRVTAIGAEMMEKVADLSRPARKADSGATISILANDITVPTPKTAPAAQAAASTPLPGATTPGALVMTGIHRLSPDGQPAVGQPPETPAPSPELQVLQVQASTQQTWDQALEQATAALSRRPDSGGAMLTLLRANHHLSSHASLDELLNNILADVLKSLNAQRAAILLADPQSGQLGLRAMLSPHPVADGKKAYSRTLAERSFRQGESLLCRDVKGEDASAVRSALFGSMSSIVCAVLRTPRKRLGVLHLDRGPLQAPFTETDLYVADAIAANMAVGIECAQLVAGQSEQFLETVTTLARAAEIRDQYTGDHTKRVTDFALMLADDLKVSSSERYQIRIGTPLHDIGKIGIEDAVLRKPGKLTDGEFEHMKSHTVKGAQMLDGFFNLAPLIPIIRSHHERWDGTGYPDKIGKGDIALSARIVAVADTFDAMTSHRPYRPALPPQLAFLELLSKAGTHFDPHVVQSFIRLRPQVEDIMRTHAT